MKLLILAGTHSQGKHYANENNLTGADFKIITGLHQIEGIKDIPIVCVGEWYKLKDAGAILRYIDYHNIKVTSTEAIPFSIKRFAKINENKSIF